MSNEGVVYSELGTFKEKQYQWSEVKQVVFHLAKENSEKSSLEFKFSDGNTINFVRDKEFLKDNYRFKQKISEHKIVFVASDEN